MVVVENLLFFLPLPSHTRTCILDSKDAEKGGTEEKKRRESPASRNPDRDTRCKRYLGMSSTKRGGTVVPYVDGTNRRTAPARATLKNEPLHREEHLLRADLKDHSAFQQENPSFTFFLQKTQFP